MTAEPKEVRRFGTPPHTLTEWLEIFARDCDDAGRHTLSPFERRRLRGMAQGYRAALDLVRCQSAD